MKRLLKFHFLTIAVLTLSLSVADGAVQLPKLISDGMVLQRDTAVDIWGWASQGEEVTLHFIDSTYTTNADSEGRWQITLPKMRAGGPYTMEISGDNRLKIRDILIGDIWVCSGQSNMELNMQRVSPLYEDEIATAKYPEIRYFEVPDTYNFSGPQSDLPGGKWKKTTPDQVLNFSAVSYFFGKAIHEQYEIPVGLINSALGGSPAQAWISEEGLKQFPEYYNEAQRFKDSTLIQRIRREDQKRIDQWYQVLREKDRGYKNPTGPWYSSEFHPTNWSTMSIPGYWANESLGSVNGVVWFRKEVEVPASMANNPARLKLGRIIDADSTFVNGEFVGTTSYQYPPRRYAIPAGVLKEGTNVIVLRVINNRGRGGFAVDKPYKIIAAGDTIDLKGEWQYKLGARMEPLRGQTFIRWKPVGLYNAMIAPLLDFRIKGVIWYQGESNTSRPVEYRELFTSLIRDWRGHWHQETLPFLFVQLPNFMEANPQPTESNWALLRESQMKALSLPNTGMAVTIDIGEWNDIHPLNKKDVGDRLARVAQKVAYGNDDIVYSGPIYESLTKEGQKIILSFTHTGSGLVAIGDEALHGFAIAGPDKKFVWADAKIRGDQVVVWSEQVENPVAVRYAWADNPKDANLYNKEGLPAAPFRTDSWEGIEK